MSDVKSLLKKLSMASGVSGSEDSVENIMMRELKGKVDKLYEDRVGNLISVKGKGKLKLLISAHMDQIGFMVKYITDEGFIKFNPVGGWDPKILPSQRVEIHTSKGIVYGVIGTKPIHVQERDEVEKVFKLKDLFIDIGAKNRKDAEKIGVRIGDFVELTGDFIELKNNRVVGKAFDNRISCTVLIEVMKRIKPKGVTVYGVGSTQEEVGLKGARGPMFGLNPDVIISADVGIAGDHPLMDKEQSPIKIGAGPYIGLQDSGYVIHEKIKKWLVDTAEKNKIPYQFDVSSGGTTEATLALITREGKPGGLVGVPQRYMHSNIELADLNDIENAIKLLAKSVETITKYF
ncbi:MAG: M42 family metallopeptidase [Candidatus Aenigmarchaeota archaeon]|nr:M42 family metallopeptidase [Candidatus Aenigmarchaeota archaeon]